MRPSATEGPLYRQLHQCRLQAFSPSCRWRSRPRSLQPRLLDRSEGVSAGNAHALKICNEAMTPRRKTLPLRRRFAPRRRWRGSQNEKSYESHVPKTAKHRPPFAPIRTNRECVGARRTRHFGSLRFNLKKFVHRPRCSRMALHRFVTEA